MEHSQLGGKFRLDRELATGGMGSVWRAFDEQLQRTVAVKMLRPEKVSKTGLARFEHEARVVAQLQTAHVIQVFDYGVEAGSPYMVMEYLEGEDLQARLDRQERISPKALLPIVQQAVKGLGVAHAAGIIHRDLKPGNIYLDRRDGDDVVKLLDFGLAALDGDNVVKAIESKPSKNFVGTPLYMSPEQLRASRSVDTRADLWSLAVVVYRALTGQFPFYSEALGDLIIKVCTENFTPARERLESLPAGFDEFFDKGLAKDPSQRFQSVAEFGAAFERAVKSDEGTASTKILVVDDEPDIPELIKQRFRRQIKKGQYEFSFASHGREALEKVREDPGISVVLTDINMPVMDGLTFLSNVAADNPDFEVIVVSAYGDMVNIRTAMNRGAFDFLVKPVDFKDLDVTIKKTVERAQERQKSRQSTEDNELLQMFVAPAVRAQFAESSSGHRTFASDTTNATVATIRIAMPHAACTDEALTSLNANLEVIVPEITYRNGELEKYVNDTVFAVFRGDRHLAEALNACIAVRYQLAQLAARTGQESPYARGVAVSIGSGPLTTARIGSKIASRVDYTVVGETVSKASQLLGFAREGHILIDEATANEAQQEFIVDHFYDAPNASGGVNRIFQVIGPRHYASQGASSHASGSFGSFGSSGSSLGGSGSGD